MDEDDGIGGGSEAFKWEQAYTEGLNIRSVLQEDEHGSVEESIRRMVMDEKRQRRMDRRPAKIRLGIMRYVHLAVDCSSAILSADFFPSRLAVALECLRNFVDKFFLLNPLSQMGLIAVRDKRAERICAFTSSVQPLVEALQDINATNCGGEFSLQSILQCALHSFQQRVHSVGGQSELKMRSVRCSIVSFGAEVFAFKRLCTTTAGKYSVALDEQHLALLLDEQVQPPPVKRRPGQQDTIVRMGFPQLRRVTDPSFCACHELNGETAPPSAIGGTADEPSKSALPRAFFCPQCGSRYCQTPVECRICGLLLLTAPQLARAHQHLESLPAFVETTIPDDENDKCCFACDEALVLKAYICPNCSTDFCIDCDLLLHESLQVCPACN
uniref:ZZ-type domain-containing protein n=1 Tax=Globodera pallida TaxID=36090 RepID=A0A183BL33_GLOPA